MTLWRDNGHCGAHHSAPRQLRGSRNDPHILTGVGTTGGRARDRLGRNHARNARRKLQRLQANSFSVRWAGTWYSPRQSLGRSPCSALQPKANPHRLRRGYPRGGGRQKPVLPPT